MSKSVLEVLNPYNEQQITTLTYHTEKQVEDALQKAHALFENKKNWLPHSERIDILCRLKEIMFREKETLTKIACEEGGKPWSDSEIEVLRAIGGVDIAIQCLKNYKGKTIPMGINPSSANRLAFTLKEPKGVVLAISAFNHPLNLIIHQVIPAVAIGAPVLVKPALNTPLSCLKVIEMLKESGLQGDWAQALLCNNDISEKLVRDSRLSFLTFIGSSKIGWFLDKILAPGVESTLEHGGSAPVIIEKTADLKKVVPSLLKGGYYHAGQVCVSVQRVFVHESLKDEFLENFTVGVSQLIVGNQLHKDVEVGPLILPREVSRVSHWVEESTQEGAQILCGGEAISNTCYAPTVLLNPSLKSLVSTQEIFGPVVCVYTYTDTNKAISAANALPFCFQSAVFTQDIDKAIYIANNLKAKAVMINDHTAFRVDWMPFGGDELSGKGVGGIPYSMEHMSHEKLWVIHSPSMSH